MSTLHKSSTSAFWNEWWVLQSKHQNLTPFLLLSFAMRDSCGHLRKALRRVYFFVRGICSVESCSNVSLNWFQILLNSLSGASLLCHFFGCVECDVGYFCVRHVQRCDSSGHKGRRAGANDETPSVRGVHRKRLANRTSETHCRTQQGMWWLWAWNTFFLLSCTF